MAVTTGSHLEVVRTNRYETERPSTLAQNVEETISTTHLGMNEAIENTNKAEESSSFEETKSSWTVIVQFLPMRVSSSPLGLQV